jgi:DNA-binding NtrC family response regulator
MTGSDTSLRGIRVLILEDDYYSAADLQTVLERSGAKVVGPFCDAAEAAQAIEREQPDCAFVDVNLGDGPSFELPRALTRQKVPFAFVTGYNGDVIPAEFEAAERLEKPFDFRRATKVASRLVQGPRSS